MEVKIPLVFFFFIRYNGVEVIKVNICKVVGVNDYNFLSSSNEMVSGRKYHLVLLSENPKHQGFEVGTRSFATDMIAKMEKAGSYIPALGDICGFSYNRFGKIADFHLVDADLQGLFDDL